MKARFQQERYVRIRLGFFEVLTRHSIPKGLVAGDVGPQRRGVQSEHPSLSRDKGEGLG